MMLWLMLAIVPTSAEILSPEVRLTFFGRKGGWRWRG